MDKQPVGQLPDLTQSNNDDEIMVITNDEYNQLKKEKISDFITDLQSTNTNNSLTTGSDGKLFVSKTINASDVDGVLSLDNIPQLSTNKLPETGISANNYSYPASITVNDRGQVVSITEGSAAEAGAYLDQSQITNCILSAPNGVATYSGSTLTIKGGLKYLTGNGRNIDKTLKNIEHTFASDKSCTFLGLGGADGVLLIVDGYANYCPKFYVYRSNKQPIGLDNGNQVWFNTDTNEVYWSVYPTTTWVKTIDLVFVAGFTSTGTTITSLTPYQPVELLKRSDKEEIASWSFPSGSFQTLSTPVQGSLYTATQDGYFVLSAFTNKTYGYIALNYDNSLSKFSSWCGINQTGVLLRCFVPASKGTKVATELFQVENAKLLFYPSKGATND